jgi:hypothetical protein
MAQEDTASTLPSRTASTTSLSSLDTDVERDEFFYFDVAVFRVSPSLHDGEPSLTSWTATGAEYPI